MKNTNKPRTKNSARENIDLFIQKKSKADSRLINDQYNTPAHIILKTDDLNIEKTKNQANLLVGLSGFVENKGNSDIASKISYQNKIDLMNTYQTTAEKDYYKKKKNSKKIMKKINRLFYHNIHL